MNRTPPEAQSVIPPKSASATASYFASAIDPPQATTPFGREHDVIDTADVSVSAINAPIGVGKPPTDPRTLRQARQGPFFAFWEEAHDAFIDRTPSLGTWKLVDPLPSDQPVPHM